MPYGPSSDEMDSTGDVVASRVVFAFSIWGDHTEHISIYSDLTPTIPPMVVLVSHSLDGRGQSEICSVLVVSDRATRVKGTEGSLEGLREE